MSDNDWVDEGWNRLFFSLGVRTSLAETLDWDQDLAEYLFDIWADQMPQFAFMDKNSAIIFMASYLPEEYEYLNDNLVNWLNINYRIGDKYENQTIN